MKLEIIVVIGAFVGILYIPSAKCWEIDETYNITYIVDGDTLDISSGDRIRLADIDTPEIGEVGYQEAKNALYSLCYGKVGYIDADDYGSTTFGRIVAMVFIDYNTTHVLNVNEYMVYYGYAIVDDFSNNEFHPSNWNLYEEINDDDNNNEWDYNQNEINGFNTIIVAFIILGMFCALRRRLKYEKIIA